MGRHWRRACFSYNKLMAWKCMIFELTGERIFKLLFGSCTRIMGFAPGDTDDLLSAFTTVLLNAAPDALISPFACRRLRLRVALLTG